MRLLPLLITSALIFVGCSAGAGMQATPPAPIAQNAGTTDYTASSRSATDDTAEDTAAAAVDDAAPEESPISQSAVEAVVPTGGGGRFLRV